MSMIRRENSPLPRFLSYPTYPIPAGANRPAAERESSGNFLGIRVLIRGHPGSSHLGKFLPEAAGNGTPAPQFDPRFPVAHKLARMLLLFVPCLLAFGLTRGPAVHQAPGQSGRRTGHAACATVYLAGDLDEEELIAFTANLHGSSDAGVPLLNGSRTSQGNRDFLAAYRPEQLILVGPSAEKVAQPGKRLGQRVTQRIPWKRGPPSELWKRWFPRAEQVVVCPAELRRLLLQAACLAGTLPAPLVDHSRRRRCRTDPHAARLANAARVRGRPGNLLGSRTSQRSRHRAAGRGSRGEPGRRHRQPAGPISLLVAANPADAAPTWRLMSVLAPYLAACITGERCC